MRLFFENKFFTFLSKADSLIVSSSEEATHSTAGLHLEAGATPTPEQLLAAVGEKRQLTIVTPDPEECFERFCASVPTVRAAGGVVENDLGEVLIMTRKGWRDLPKGHIDEGESAEEAAVREVMEECGLQSVEIVTPLCTTRHFHRAYGRWEIKQTEWFLMHAAGESPTLYPQEEEGITAVEWLRARRLWQAVDGSYSTIKEVFEEFLKFKIQ